MPIPKSYGLSTLNSSIIRPSNTTAYADGDVLSPSVATNLVFTPPLSPQLLPYLVRAWLVTDKPAHSEQIRLYLSANANTTLAADNAAFTSDAEPFGAITFSSWVKAGSFAIADGDFNRFLPLLASPFYGNVEVKAFTPTSGQLFKFYLAIETPS